MKKKTHKKTLIAGNYATFLRDIQSLLSEGRRQAARTVNAIMTAAYWEVGRRITEFELGGQKRAAYGEELVRRLSEDLTQSFGRGFGYAHVKTMRQFYEAYPDRSRFLHREELPYEKGQSLIGQSFHPMTSSHQRPNLALLSRSFTLSWTHYARLLRVKNNHARAFYEAECLRGGWSIRQLDRQIDSQFYERTALSKNKKSMLKKGARTLPGDKVTPEQEIKSPYVLEFLGLKDEYSESELEEGLIRHLESFLMELGGDFAFVARQKRLRLGNEWYRVDLVFYHRRLRCLVLIDLKIGRFTHADAGQMHLYLNYAREHWTHEDENPPVGLILCAEKDEDLAKYALEGLPNKVLASEYRTALPKEGELVKEIQRSRRELQLRTHHSPQKN